MTGPAGASVQLRTLGSVDLRAQDGSQMATVLRQPKRLALLVYFALSGNVFVRRDRVLALFWPESDEKSARGSLSQAVFQLRAALGRNAIVGRGDDELAVNADEVWCDAVAFQEAVRAGNAAQAMELYRGELLPSFTVDETPGFEDWLAQRRTELAAQASVCCRQLADDTERAGDFEAAEQWLRRAISIQPFNESLHQRLIQVLDRKGDKAAALHVFEELRGMLRNEFDTDPAAETLELMEDVRARAPGLRRNVAQGLPQLDRPAPAPAAKPGMSRHGWLVAGFVVIAVVAITWLALWARRPPPDRLPLNHVAVLYFNDESPKHDVGYLADGLTSTLIEQLGQVQQLQVISQNGVRTFRGANVPLDSIARQLDVGVIVGGSVTRSDGRLRVTVEMIEGATGVALRTRTVERPVGELFALLDDISGEVSAFLRSTVGQQIRTVGWRSETKNVEAWRALQQAEYMRTNAEQLEKEPRNLQEAVALLAQADSLAQRALELDKHFASALVMRGEIAHRRAYMGLFTNPPADPNAWLKIADEMAERALALNDRSAAAFELRGTVRQSRWMVGTHTAGSDSLLDLAERDLRTSLLLGGERSRAESVLSTVLYEEGHFAEARTAALRALAADAYLTEADQVVNRLFETSFELGDDAEAGHWCDEVRHRFEQQWPSAWCDLTLLAWSREGNADPRKAVHLLENFGSADPLHDAMRPRIAMLTAAVIARAGLRDSANAMLKKARAQAPGDIELLHLEAAARLQMKDDARALELLRDYLRLNPRARLLMLNSRIFARLRNRIG